MLFWPCSNHVLDTSEKSAGAGQSHSCEDCEGDGDCEPYSLVFCCSGFKVIIEEPPRRTRQVDIRKYYPFSCVSLPVTRKVDSPTTKIIKKKVVKAAMATAAKVFSTLDEWQQQNLQLSYFNVHELMHHHLRHMDFKFLTCK